MIRFASHAHTCYSINVEGHNLVNIRDMKLKLFPTIMPCWCLLLIMFQVNSLYESEVIIVNIGKLDAFGRPLFTNPVMHNDAMMLQYIQPK